MDRRLTYPGATPVETDLLWAAREAMVGLGCLYNDLIGTQTLAARLPCTPSGMTVSIGAGSIYSQQPIDATPYSSLPANANVIIKQGLLFTPVVLACPAPGSGTLYYLIEATFQESDVNLVTLPYYNASNTSQAYSGPANNGQAQATLRQAAIVLQLKSGTTPPAVDAGYIALYTITVPAGAVALTNITQVTANFLPQGPYVTPLQVSHPFYRYGAKGKAGRTGDAFIAGAVLTSASGGFAGAQAGMVCVVVDGGASRVGGRPAPLTTTIASVQSANQITLSTPVIQPGTIVMTGVTNTNTYITSPSVNPITAGVGLTRAWIATGTNIPAGSAVILISPTALQLSQSTTGAASVTVTLTAPIEVCFGFDDSAAINAALAQSSPIPDVHDNFLTTQPLTVGGAGCNNISLPSAMIIFALANNASHCVTAAGLDRGNTVYLDGARYLPFKVEVGELECCNTGLDGFSLQPSISSTVRARINNPFRNAFSEFFLNGGWQEGNLVDITCGRVGLHFHHKVSKSACYQTLGGYRIMGRAPGLNSVYLGINATTQKDQLGGGIRIYAGGGATPDGGISQNVWGMQASCELDGQRSCALSFGSDICNSPVTFADASLNYVIEGNASATYSNTYRANLFGAMVIEDISASADGRGGYQYFAMPNTIVQSTTILSPSAGPWGQTYINPVWQMGADNFTRYQGALTYSGIYELGAPGNTASVPILQGGSGTIPAPPVLNNQSNSTVAVGTAAFATLITGDYNMMFFVRDTSSGGGAIGFMTTDTTTVTLASSTLSGVSFKRTATVGLQAQSTSGTRNLATIAFATGV